MKRWEKYQGQRKYLIFFIEKISKWKYNHTKSYQQEQSILVFLSSEKIIQNTLSEIIDYLYLESVNNVLTMFSCLTCSTFNFQL